MQLHDLGLDWGSAWAGVVAGSAIYLVVILLTRVFGQRTLSTMSSFDFPATVAIGAVIGRTALVRTTLVGGIVALATLFVVQAAVGAIRNRIRGGIIDNRPLALVVDGEIQADLLRRAHMNHDDVHEKLRLSGVHRMDEVRLLVLERSGGLSVVRGHESVDHTLLAHVVGADRMRGSERDRPGR